MGKVEVFEFSNGETFVKLDESIRNNEVFIFQPFCSSRAPSNDRNGNAFRTVNDNLLELLILIDACKRASAKSISCVVPYYGYSRTDKKDQSGTPITAKLIADMIGNSGAKRVITFDLHSQQIQGFFDIPVDNLSASYLFAKHFYDNFGIDVVVSPDSGGVERARELSKRINYARRKDKNCSDSGHTTVAFGDKRRTSNDDKAILTHIIGDVVDKNVLIYDDIVDTAGSLTKVASALKDHGARNVFAACVHGVFSGNAIKKIEESCIKKIYVTDTMPIISSKRDCPKVEIISIAKILAEAIVKIYRRKSVSELFRIEV